MVRIKRQPDAHDPDRPNRMMLPFERNDDGGLAEDVAGIVSYRASAVGGCSRALVCAGLDYTPEPPPDWLQERFDEGHTLEPLVLDILRTGRSLKLLRHPDSDMVSVRVDDDSEQTSHRLDVGTVDIDGEPWKVTVMAHSDAMGLVRLSWDTPESEAWTAVDIEVKCFRDDLWAKFVTGGVAAMPDYAWQASARMHAHGLPILFVVARKKGSLRAGDGDLEIVDMACELVTTPLVPLKDFKKRLLKIESRIGDQELPACDLRQYPCPYYYAHDDDAEQSRIRVDDELLAGQIKAYNEAAARAAAAEADKKRLMDGIRAWLEVNGMAVDGAKVTVKSADKTVDGTKVSWVAYWREEKVVPAGLVAYPKVTAKKPRRDAKGTRGTR